jgi:TRAP-type C4-dicarboxylate transport system permease small subunit
MGVARNAGRLIDWLSRSGLYLAAALVAFLMLTQVLEVVLRSIGRPTTWVYDLNLSALLGVVFLALADAERAGEHVAVDFLSGRIGGIGPRVLRIFNGVISVAFLLMLAWFGTLVALQSAEQGRMTGGLFSIPTAVPEALLPIGATILVLQTIVMLFRGSSPEDDGPPVPTDSTGEPIPQAGDIVSSPTSQLP